MTNHTHFYWKLVANRPGLATIACQCGALTLHEYPDGKALDDLKEALKIFRSTRMAPIKKL